MKDLPVCILRRPHALLFTSLILLLSARVRRVSGVNKFVAYARVVDLLIPRFKRSVSGTTCAFLTSRFAYGNLGLLVLAGGCRVLLCLRCTTKHTALDDRCSGSAIIVDNRNVAVIEVDHAGSSEGSRAWGGCLTSMSGRLLLVELLLIGEVLQCIGFIRFLLLGYGVQSTIGLL